MLVTLLIVALIVLVYAVFARRLEGTPLTAPILFAGAGFLLGADGLGVLALDLRSPVLHVLVEGALVLVLFSDASRVRVRGDYKRDFSARIPSRLLIIGLPLTIVFGTLATWWVFPEFLLVEAALLAVMLAPTDAALGQAVVSDPSVPLRIRQSLNIESGLNDGIAVPVFTAVFAAACAMVPELSEHESIGRFALMQLTLGPLAGVLVALPCAKLAEWALGRGFASPASTRLAGLSIAVTAFAAASFVGGNGLIAAFVAGLVVGNTSRLSEDEALDFVEEEGELLVLLAFLVFGAAMLPRALEIMDLRILIYALLSLTLLRMIPVALSLVGTGLKWPTLAFLGWFGPRGLATVLFALVVHQEGGHPAAERIFAIAASVVAASIVLHGASASVLARAYGRWSERLRRAEPSVEECLPVTERPVRFRALDLDCSQEREG